MLEEKKYDEIFKIYGSDYYCTFVPKKYRKMELKKLLNMGNFKDIYMRLGSDYYNYLGKMKDKDIFFETNKHSKILADKACSQLKVTLSALAIVGFYFGTVYDMLTAAMANNYDFQIQENSIRYAKEISMYDEKIEKYAMEINSLGLNDLQIIVKVIYDMWSSIAGYDEPKLDVFGYERLDFLEDGGVGVCRNMADDVCAKLNAINPNYNARTLAVKMNGIPNTSNIQIVDLRASDESNENINTENSESLGEILIGNHKVVMMDIPNDNLTLIVDPTNPSIGIFRNGKIYMFSSYNNKNLEVKLLSSTINGISAVNDYRLTTLKSFFDNYIDIDTLDKKYGIDAQNEALNYIISLSNEKAKQMTK